MARRLSLCALGAFVLLLLAPSAQAQQGPPGATVRQGVERGEDGGRPAGVGIEVSSEDGALSRTVTIVLLLTVASVAPAILLMMTSFTRFAVVLALTRQALGLQGIPPNQVLIGLAMFMTFFVMNPVLGQINDRALQPALKGRISTTEAIENGYGPLRKFMLEQTDDKDLELFTALARDERPRSEEDIPASALIPAFIISELRTAFVIGFVIFIPFLVIDLVVSASLMSLGMVMVPPIVISLPLKLLLFVLVDGWGLLVRSVLASVTGGG